MFTRSILTLAVSGLVLASTVQAGPIFSGPAQISNLGSTLVFDLLAGGDLDTLEGLPTNAADYNIQVISVVWSFDPPPGGNGFLDLGGTLAVAGVDSGLTFGETIDMADETGNVVFSQNNGGSSGLPFGQTLAQQFLDNNGKLFGGVVAAPGTENAWDDFFEAGGKLTNYLFVEMTVRDTNQIPEPTAMLVWGGVGGLGLIAYRWRRRRQSA